MTVAECPSDLQLIGYITLTARGFALPCFGHGEWPNTVYIARSDPPGAPSARVVWFEPFDGGPFERLPAGHTRRVRLGDPFTHVFIWDGAIYVGAAIELWETLAPLLEDLKEHAPLTLLDLAEGVSSASAAQLAHAASAWIAGRHGEARARRWRTETYFRGIVVRTLRQQLGEADWHWSDAAGFAGSRCARGR